jgi:hypothetical protein
MVRESGRGHACVMRGVARLTNARGMTQSLANTSRLPARGDARDVVSSRMRYSTMTGVLRRPNRLHFRRGGCQHARES